MPLDFTGAVCNLERLSRILEGARRLLAEKDVIALDSKTMLEQIIIGRTKTLTQSPPACDLHPSPPIQKSEEPLSMRMEKSRAGVPTWTVAT